MQLARYEGQAEAVRYFLSAGIKLASDMCLLWLAHFLGEVLVKKYVDM